MVILSMTPGYAIVVSLTEILTTINARDESIQFPVFESQIDMVSVRNAVTAGRVNDREWGQLTWMPKVPKDVYKWRLFHAPMFSPSHMS